MELRWRQPFRWGLLTAFDADSRWEMPELVASDDDRPQATSTCLAVYVRHSQDVEIPDDLPEGGAVPEAEVEVTVSIGEGLGSSTCSYVLQCPTGRLCIGDAETERVIEVPPGALRIGVTQRPQKFAEQVQLWIDPA